jgi:hypothetical protein
MAKQAANRGFVLLPKNHAATKFSLVLERVRNGDGGETAVAIGNRL